MSGTPRSNGGQSRVAAGLQSRSNNGNGQNYPPPRLQVTVPPPTHPGLQQPQQHSQQHQHQQQRSPYGNGPGYSRSPLSSSQNSNSSSSNGHHQNQNQNHSPVHAHSHAHAQQYYVSPPSPFSGSSETLIGSSESSHFKAGSIRNMKMSDPASGPRTAHPDNDRLAPSSASQPDFWKRFSTVLHESEKRDQLGEKTGGAKGKKTESPWLEKTNHKITKHRVWGIVIALLIIGGIAGGVAYHFLTKEKTDGSEEADQPTTHNFGAENAFSSSSRAKAASTSGETSSLVDEVINTMPSPSSLAPGMTLHDNDRRAVAQQTAIPVAAVVVVKAERSKMKRASVAARNARRHHAGAPLSDLD